MNPSTRGPAALPPNRSLRVGWRDVKRLLRHPMVDVAIKALGRNRLQTGLTMLGLACHDTARSIPFRGLPVARWGLTSRFVFAMSLPSLRYDYLAPRRIVFGWGRWPG